MHYSHTVRGRFCAHEELREVVSLSAFAVSNMTLILYSSTVVLPKRNSVTFEQKHIFISLQDEKVDTTLNLDMKHFSLQAGLLTYLG